MILRGCINKYYKYSLNYLLTSRVNENHQDQAIFLVRIHEKLERYINWDLCKKEEFIYLAQSHGVHQTTTTTSIQSHNSTATTTKTTTTTTAKTTTNYKNYYNYKTSNDNNNKANNTNTTTCRSQIMSVL